jgi:hypothetical protein
VIVVIEPALLHVSPLGHADGPGARLAREIAAIGRPVELVARVPEGPSGDRAIVDLGLAGVGHAAVLRVITGEPGPGEAADPALESADLDLALRYLPDVRVIASAAPLPPDLVAVIADAAQFHGAAIVAVERQTGRTRGGAVRSEAPGTAWPGDATVLGVVGDTAPIAMLADYAARLDAGQPAEAAFRDAVASLAPEALP